MGADPKIYLKMPDRAPGSEVISGKYGQEDPWKLYSSCLFILCLDALTSWGSADPDRTAPHQTSQFLVVKDLPVHVPFICKPANPEPIP